MLGDFSSPSSSIGRFMGVTAYVVLGGIWTGKTSAKPLRIPLSGSQSCEDAARGPSPRAVLTSVVDGVLVLWFFGHFGGQGIHPQDFVQLAERGESQRVLERRNAASPGGASGSHRPVPNRNILPTLTPTSSAL